MSPARGGADSALVEPEADVLRIDARDRRRLRRPGLALASDERLARRAAGGEPGAFEEIFRRYQQDLYRFCVGILRDPQDAQDAVQNTMIRTLRALPGETRQMQLKPWLYRIAHNEAIELRRRERPVEPLGPAIDDTAAGTEERAEQGARLKTLLADIADLPERQRASLVMRELNGLGFGEIGVALGTSPGAVRQALYEARRGLGEMESGREMDCELAMKQVSDADGAPTRRGIRAHLRDCHRCRRSQAEMRERREALAAISPMPALALAALLKRGLGGSGGVAATGIGAGGAAAGGAGGIGAGGLGALGVAGMVKATAGLVAALAVGTVAVDHGVLLRHGGGPGRAGDRPAHVRPVEAAKVEPMGPADHPFIGSPAVGVAVGTAGERSASAVRRGSSAATEPGGAPSAPGAGRSQGSPRDVAPGASHARATHPSPVQSSSDGDTVRVVATVGGGNERSAAAEKSPAEHAEPGAGGDASEGAKKAGRAGAKAEKGQAKAEAKAEKAAAKVEKAEAKEDPEHLEGGTTEPPTSTTSTGSPSTAPTPEPTPSKEHPEHPGHPAHAEAPPVAPTATEATEIPSEGTPDNGPGVP